MFAVLNYIACWEMVDNIVRAESVTHGINVVWVVPPSFLDYVQNSVKG